MPIWPQTGPERAQACPTCGSRGANLHQYTARRVVDPRVDQALVTRYTCKACGYVRRQYPTGVGTRRLSLAMVQVCRVLRAFGLSYQNIRMVLTGLGCRVSVGAVRRAVGRSVEPPVERLRLAPRAATRLAGPDGAVAFAWGGSDEVRHLVIEIAPGPQADPLRRRLEWAIVHTKNGT